MLDSRLIPTLVKSGFVAMPQPSKELLAEIVKQAEQQGITLVQVTIMGLQSEDGLLLYDSTHTDHRLVPYDENHLVDSKASQPLHESGYVCACYGYDGAHYLKHNL